MKMQWKWAWWITLLFFYLTIDSLAFFEMMHQNKILDTITIGYSLPWGYEIDLEGLFGIILYIGIIVTISAFLTTVTIILVEKTFNKKPKEKIQLAAP